MFIGSTKQLLASIGLGLGLAVMTFTAPMTDNAHAAPIQPTVNQDQSACESQGFAWDSKKKRCANRNCYQGGTPGATKSVRYKNGDIVHFYCNGFTGLWETVG